jgi:hypothetical protein
MTNNLICLPKDYILVVFSLIIGISSWYIYIKNNDNLFDRVKNYIDLNNKEPIATNKSDIVTNKSDIINNIDFVEKRLILENRDRKVLNDNFAPPERRVPEYQYPDNIKNYINIPSKGYPDNYQLMGIVIRDNTETAYNLYGRQTYPRSNEYEYYVQKTDYHNNVKIPIKNKGNIELVDNQIIDIIGTNHEKGIFRVKLYNYDLPRYNPYII